MSLKVGLQQFFQSFSNRFPTNDAPRTAQTSAPNISFARLNHLLDGDGDKPRRTMPTKVDAPKINNPQSAPNEAFMLIIPMKEGTRAEYEQLQRAVVREVFARSGHQISRAAVEEVLAQTGELDLNDRIHFDRAKGEYTAQTANGKMPSVEKFRDEASGRLLNGYRLLITPQFQKSILQHREQALATTATGKKALVEMTMNERYAVLIGEAQKHLPKNAAEALKLIDPQILMTGLAAGAVIGSAVKKEYIGVNAVKGVLGGVAVAQAVGYGARANSIANQTARARSVEDLSKPAQELAQLIKDGGVDILLAAAGYGASRLAPKTNQAIDDINDGGKKALEATAELAQATQRKLEQYADEIARANDELLTPQTANNAPIKEATAKPELTAEDINRPIVSVDSQGKPSGTRFRNDYDEHIKLRDYSKKSQTSGVNGGHDMAELEKYAVTKSNPTITKDSINIVSKIPHPSVKGIYKIEYQMPVLDRTLTPTGVWRNGKGGQPFVKTVYDSSVISDAQMMQWGREAFADAVSKGFDGAKTNRWSGFSSNGIEFRGYTDKQGTDAVRTFFPVF